ncbi:NUMOD3 domain-containing DNA-binding protein [Sporosarcina pasteurii]|uniref:NUMOD3 domain-containing DNA-binding protein n=1 Tax=Sporosarcina pasteurii TaxID=1474 RepID=UPI001068C99E|nr:NUMOD3 domain-containing DNA-binding protein [Sporosarcina pasteurii]MDS9472528.1 NUMOD3 domain-containing DNA-binding protein [Sporosarcina pasteurii]QBQ06082.1 hypothetical protein E2C16_10560 [Sporosarcina pasteurii]
MLIFVDKLTKNQKISQAMKGRTLSTEHKQNISKARKGQVHSDKTKEKIKNTLLGENRKDKSTHRLVPKSTMSRSHLTAEDVKEIRDRYSNEKGASIRLLAKDYSVSRHTIHSIINYKIWK